MQPEASSLLCLVPTCSVPGLHRQTCQEEECRGCLPAQPLQDLKVCRLHHRLASEALPELPRLFEDMALVLGGSQGSKSVATFSASGPESQGISLAQHVSDTRDDLRAFLRDGCLAVAPSIPREVPEQTAFLMVRLSAILRSAQAGLFVDALLSLRSRARRAAYPVRDTSLVLGRCPYPHLDDETQPCGGKVVFDPSVYAGESLAACRTCGACQGVQEWRKVLGPAESLGSGTADVASLLVSTEVGLVVSHDLLSKWFRRGHITASGLRGKNTLYDLGSVLMHARKVKQRALRTELRAALAEAPRDRWAAVILDRLDLGGDFLPLLQEHDDPDSLTEAVLRHAEGEPVAV